MIEAETALATLRAISKTSAFNKWLGLQVTAASALLYSDRSHRPPVPLGARQTDTLSRRCSPRLPRTRRRGRARRLPLDRRGPLARTQVSEFLRRHLRLCSSPPTGWTGRVYARPRAQAGDVRHKLANDFTLRMPSQ